MKQFSLIPGLLFISITINSQINNQISIGINGGLTYSNIIQTNGSSWDYDFIPGFKSGVNFELELKSNINIVTEICYYQNGYNLKDKARIGRPDLELSKSYVGFDDKSRQNYLNNSWMCGYSVGNKIEISFYAGFYWAIFLNSNYKLKTYIFVDYEEWVEIGDTALPVGYQETIDKGKHNEGYSSFDFGLTGGIKLAVNLNQKFQLFCFPRYNQGIVDIYKPIITNEIKKYNCSFNISLGINMKL